MRSDDYVMVPRVATKAMVEAGEPWRYQIRQCYDAMIAAAPPSPRSDDGEGNKIKCPTCFGLGGYGLSNDGGPAERCDTCEGFGTVAAPPSPTPSVEVGEMVERIKDSFGEFDEIKKMIALLLSLDAERGRMREALKPFADAAERWTDIPGVLRYDDSVQLWQNGRRVDYITVGDLRRARSALPASDERDSDA